MNTNETILNQKLELIQWLSTIEDSAIIQKIMDLRKKKAQIGGILFLKMRNNPLNLV